MIVENHHYFGQPCVMYEMVVVCWLLSCAFIIKSSYMRWSWVRE